MGRAADIEKHVMRSRQPLDEEQRFLLNDLLDRPGVLEFSPDDQEFPVHFRLKVYALGFVRYVAISHPFSVGAAASSVQRTD